MTASERARELVHRNEGAAMTFWATQTVPNYETVKQTRAALLAYVARLEAFVAVARDVVDSANADVVFGSDLSTEERRLSDLLAALDRPEDGNGEQG